MKTYSIEINKLLEYCVNIECDEVVKSFEMNETHNLLKDFFFLLLNEFFPNM